LARQKMSKNLGHTLLLASGRGFNWGVVCRVHEWVLGDCV
jgi:hypothetical protein